MGGNLQQADIALTEVPHVFISLCRLLKYETGKIPKNIFLMFPDLLRNERLLRARFAREGKIRADEMCDGKSLLRLLAKGAKNPEAARKLLNQVAAAIQVQPQETAKALLRETKGSGGSNAGLRHVVQLIRQHGAPVSGATLDVLISGWAVCAALAKSAVVLGTMQASGGNVGHKANIGTLISASMGLRRLRKKAAAAHHENAAHQDSEDDHIKPTKLSVAAKVAIFGTRLLRKVPGTKKKQYRRKVAVSNEMTVEEEHWDKLWQILHPSEVLRCLRAGAKALDGEDFKQLLQAAWALLDECDAVSFMIEPKKKSDARATQLLAIQQVLAGIVTADSHPGQLRDAKPMHQLLVRSYAVLHQLKQICDVKDDAIMRRAALFGLPSLLERISIWVHASVDQIVDPMIAQPSRAAAHEMDSLVAKALESFKPYEIAFEDGLGYQVSDPSDDTFLCSGSTRTAGAAVVCEEAWKSFLRDKEDARSITFDTGVEDWDSPADDQSGAWDSDRFCNTKLVTPGVQKHVNLDFQS